MVKIFSDTIVNNNQISVTTHYSLGSETFKLDSLLDIGATVCLLDYRSISNKILSLNLQPTRELINGIENRPILAKGELLFDIKLGNCLFPAVKFLVMDKLPVPAIIGRSVLQERCTQMHLNYDKLIVRFFNDANDVRSFGFAPFTKAKRPLGAEINVVNNDLKGKIKFLKDKYSIDLSKCEHSEHEVTLVADLLIDHGDAFASEDAKIGLFQTPARIPTVEGKSVNQPQHPVAKRYESVVDSEIKSMLKDNVIEFCTDNKGWNSPVFIVDKSDGSPRFVVNFKKTLNMVLIEEETFPMPNAEILLGEIGIGNTYFGSLDVRSGYWHVGIHESDRCKTAFHWKGKTYQFTRIPFGLKTSGNIFSRAVNLAMNKIPTSNNKTYVDDMLQHGKCFQDYFHVTKQVLQACIKSNIKLGGKKCAFLQKSAKFLGRRLNSLGYEPIPEYLQGIESFPPPTNRRELQRFIGRLVWVRSHMEPRTGEKIADNSFASLIKPMTAVLRLAKFSWDPKAQRAFELAKERLSSPPIFRFADFDREFVMITDASLVCVAAVLTQIGADGTPYLCATASKTLTDPMTRWSATERECYAIVFGLDKFSYFLKGRKFIIQTDHKPLTYLDTTTFRNSKIERWYNFMSQFWFTVQYLPGVDNHIADLLSRPSGVKAPPKVDTTNLQIAGEFFTYDDILIYRPSWVNSNARPVKCDIDNILPEVRAILAISCNKSFVDEAMLGEFDMMVKYQSKDRVISQLINAVNKGSEPTFLDTKVPDQNCYLKWYNKLEIHHASGLLLVKLKDGLKILVPRAVRPALVFNMHNKHMHVGTPKVLDLLKTYTWPTIASDTKNFVQSCDLCCRRKASASNQTPPLLHLARPSAPFQVCYMDFIKMPTTELGYKYALTYICGFSRYLITVPLRHERASDCARALITNVFLPYEPPLILSSDRGSAFTSALAQETCRVWGVDLKLHVAWRPQSTGVLERVHRVLKDCIFIVCHEQKCNWLRAMPMVTKALNVTFNKATKVSPYEAIYGVKNRLGNVPDDFRNHSNSPKTHSIMTRLNLHKIHQQVKFYQSKADDAMDRAQKTTLAPELDIGSFIYLKRPQSAFAKEFKLSSVGPYEVVNHNDSVVVLRDTHGNEDFVHRSHCHPVTERTPEFDNFPNALLPLPPPLNVVEKPKNSVVRNDLTAATEIESPLTEESNGSSGSNLNEVTQLVQPRYPTRNRIKNTPLNIKSTHGKAY